MGIDGNIDLSREHRATVLALVEEHLSGTTVWAHGSRVAWHARETSDLDLVVFTTPEQKGQVGALREALEESNLPFRVDLLVWDDLPESFRSRIESDHQELVARAGSGRYPRDWPVVRIDEIAQVGMGPFGSSIKVSTFVPSGVPVISGQHLHGIRVDESPGFNFITPEHAQRLSNANVGPGDVIFTHAGNIGQVAYVPADANFTRYVISQRQFYLRCDRTRANPEFLTYFFRSREGQHRLLANASQVGVPSIAQPVSYLRSVEIPLPPLREQDAIARILGALDARAELHRRMNATLEAMARALFKSWFVDFDPVLAKMEGRDPGLPPKIADLFPDRLVDSELGEIPAGWMAVPLAEIIDINPSRSLPKGVVAPYLDMASIPTRGHMPHRIRRRVAGSGSRFRNGDTLVARITPCLENGKTAFVSCLKDGEVAWGSTEFIVLRPRPPVPNEVAYCIARTSRFREYAIQSMTGTSGRQRVQAPAIAQFVVARATPSIYAAFRDAVHILFSTAAETERCSGVTASLRDSLLPKLVSGEVRLPATLVDRHIEPDVQVSF